MSGSVRDISEWVLTQVRSLTGRLRESEGRKCEYTLSISSKKSPDLVERTFLSKGQVSEVKLAEELNSYGCRNQPEWGMIPRVLLQ